MKQRIELEERKVQHAKLALLLIVLISTPMAYVLYTRASSDPPAVILRLGNYQSSLQPTIIGYGGIGVTFPFIINLNFTVTNLGNATSREFLIFVSAQARKWVVPANPNPIYVQPIQPNETRLIELNGYSARCYPDISFQYYGQVATFHFGDLVTVNSTIGLA